MGCFKRKREPEATLVGAGGDVGKQGETGQKSFDGNAKSSPARSPVSLTSRAAKMARFTLLDIVEDGVRVRLLNVWAFMLIYVFMVFGLLKIAKQMESTITRVDISTPMPHFRMSGNTDKELAVLGNQPVVTPKVVMYDQNGKVIRGAKAKVEVIDFESDGPVDCSMSTTAERMNTLSAFNYKDLCAYNLVGQESKEAVGLSAVASFDVFEIHGPTGMYTLQVSSGSAKAATAQKVAVITPVAEMWVVHPESGETLESPDYLKIGDLLDPQPAVLLLDPNGLPVANRSVVVFPNPDPTWPPNGETAQEPPTYGARGQKATELECATSEPSDQNGLAKFKCLRVLGSTIDHINWIFSESGLIFTPWNDPTDSPHTLYPLQMVKFRPATYLGAREVNKVVTMNSPYTTIVEGQAFDPAPSVNVTDEHGNALSGITCYAMITKWANQLFPLYFGRARKGIKTKELYNVKAMTDSDGIAVWENLTLSVQGNVIFEEGLRKETNSSMYIGFVCDGEFQEGAEWWDMSGGHVNQVQSIVKTIEIKRFTSDSAYLTTYQSGDAPDASAILTAVVRVLDTDGKGVAGKNVVVEPHYLGSGFVVKNVASAMEPTGDSGFAVVSFVVALAPDAIATSGTTTFKVRFSVDGVLSDASEALTVRTERANDVTQCNMVTVSTVRVRLDDGYVDFNPEEEVPHAISGSHFQVFLTLRGQTVSSCTHFPDLVGGSEYVDASRCGTVGSSGSGRRLREQEEDEDPELTQLYKEAERRLREEPQPHHKTPRQRRERRLSSASSDGSIVVTLRSAYSTAGEELCDGYGRCTYKVPHLPTDLLDVQVLAEVEPPTLTDLSAAPGSFPVSVMALGANGDHFLKFEVTLMPEGPDGEELKCETPPIQFRVDNPVYMLSVEGDNELSLFGGSVDAGAYLPLTIELITDGDSNYSLATSSKYAENGIYWKWVEYPASLSWIFPDPSMVPPPAESEYFKITELDADGNPVGQGQGWDADKGLRIGVMIKKPGMIGQYAIQFGLAGLWSDVATFTVNQPSNLKVEIVTEPAHSDLDSEGRIKTMTVLSQQPVVYITSDGAPLEGAVVTAEFVPSDATSLFQRLTDVNGSSPLPMIYSQPSGVDGMARFELLAMLDGYGCGQYKFVLVYDEVESSLTSTLCFGNAFRFKIFSQPPTSMPLDMPLSDMSSAAPVIVEAHFEKGLMPDLTCPEDTSGIESVCPRGGFGALVMRVLVAEAGGKGLSLLEAKAASRTMLEEHVCFWVDMEETSGRCSNLEIVQKDPFVLLRFKIWNLRWKRITKYPADMRMMVTDLSGTDYLWEVSAPDALDTSPEALAETCLDSLMEGETLRKDYVTQQIQAETTVASTVIVLPPPQTTFVGEAFLVRIQLLSKHGGPIKGKLMRACLASLGSTTPSRASPSFLHSLTKRAGFTSSTVCGTDAYLAPSGVIRRSNSRGIVSFPLVIQAAATGTYVIHFQPEEPGSKVQATTSKFRIYNYIANVTNAEDEWGELEIPEFGKLVEVPRKPVFRVEPYSLENLESIGIPVEVTLVVKAASPKQSAAKKSLKEARKADAQAAKDRAKEKQQAIIEGARSAFSWVEEAVQTQSKGVFSMLESDYAELCLGSRASTLASGDSTDNVNEIEVQETSMSDEVMLDPDIVEPSEMLNTFVGTFSSGGAEMTSRLDSQPQLTLTLGLSQLERVSDAADSEFIYTLKDRFHLNFQPDFEYHFTIRVNGVESDWDDFPIFTVEQAPPPLKDVVFAWVMNFISVILACIILITNTRKHHRAWFIVALLATAASIVAVPFLKDKDEAMGGYWKWIALSNLVLVAACLVWGLLCEIFPNVPFLAPFETKRQKIFEEYVARRTKELLMAQDLPPAASITSNLLAIVKPLSSQTAFYFPSTFLTAMVIGISSFIYVIVWIINLRKDIEGSCEALKQKAVAALFKQTVNMGEQFYQAVGQDLPDEANQFMYNQLELVSSWFDELVAAVQLALMIGIVVAAVIVIICMIFSAYDFRSKALGMRQGQRYTKKKVKLATSATFVGFFVTALFAGFAIVTLLVTLVVLPFMWSLLWKMIWGYKWVVVTLLIPRVITAMVNKFEKSSLACAFSEDSFKNRSIASFAYFWQTYNSLLGGMLQAAGGFISDLARLCFSVPTIALPRGSGDDHILAKDRQYEAYLSAVLTYHILNAPIFAIAAKRLWNICAARQHFKERGVHWTSTRSLVILLLMRFPMLKQWRKAAIAARNKELELRKKRGLKAAAGPAAATAASKTLSAIKMQVAHSSSNDEGSTTVAAEERLPAHGVMPSKESRSTTRLGRVSKKTQPHKASATE